MSSRVFISYGKEDRRAAEAIYAHVKNRGLLPWLDQHDLPPGVLWGDLIPEQIRRSDYFLILLSSRSSQRRGYLQREIRIALDVVEDLPQGTVYIVPIRLDDCEIPTRLRQFQWINAFPSVEDGLRGLERLFALEPVAPLDASQVAAPPPGFRPARDVARDVLLAIQHRFDRGGRPTPGIGTGFEDLDAITGGGLQKGELILLGGRPSIGKTVFYSNIAWHAAVVENRSVAVVSLAASREDLTRLLLCSAASVDTYRLRRASVSADDQARLAKAQEQLNHAKLFLVDPLRATFARVAASVRELASTEGVDLLVIDYYQLIAEREDGDVAFRDLARDLQIPVLLVVQLPDVGFPLPPNVRPHLGDVEDCGRLLELADAVFLLHREGAYSPRPEDAGYADLIVARQRLGVTSTIRLQCDLSRASFRDFRIAPDFVDPGF